MVVHHFAVINLSKKCDWYHINLQYYKPIACFCIPSVHIFNPHTVLSYVEIDEIVFHIYTGWGSKI